jgi:fucose permease
MAIMLGFCVAAEILISSRLALYMRRTWNFEMEKASLYVTYFFVCMLLGRLVFALVKFPLSIRHQLSLSLIGSSFFVILGIHFHPIFLTFVGWTVAPFYPLCIAWISTKFPEDLDTALSYIMTIDSIMLVLMHLLVGAVTDYWNIATALYLGPVFLIISFVLVNLFESIFEGRKV